jgi:cyclophilin family peptidyl-prolyl cis-trans isomerase
VPRRKSLVYDARKGTIVSSPSRKGVSLPLFCLSACICLSLLTLTAGCGKPSADGETSPTAAIGGTEQGAPSSGGATAANAKKADPLHPVILIETTLGNIKVRLDAEKAQGTVNNFLTYVKESFYDQTIIHQVNKGYGFIAGGYDVNRKEKPTHIAIRNEAENGLKNVRGTIAMVRQPDLIDSATSQFMINFRAENPALDYKEPTPQGYGYCVFGEVIEGMDVVAKINEAQVEDTGDFERSPTPPIIINSIRKIN